MVWVICVTAVVITAMICFKGIVVHRKTEIVQRKKEPVYTPQEMEEIEKKLNAVDEVNRTAEGAKGFEKVPGSAPQVYPMDKVLRNLQEVFGPELEEDNDGSR